MAAPEVSELEFEVYFVSPKVVEIEYEFDSVVSPKVVEIEYEFDPVIVKPIEEKVYFIENEL